MTQTACNPAHFRTTQTQPEINPAPNRVAGGPLSTYATPAVSLRWAAGGAAIAATVMAALMILG